MKRYYVLPDGEKVPLYEAPYRYKLTAYKSDCRRAQIGNPEECVIALGARRDKDVESAHIGSGKDAYLVFKARPHHERHALHFTMSASARRVRDEFDTKRGGKKTVEITLSPPTAGRTLEARSKQDKNRRERIKAGLHIVNKRGAPKASRIIRLGVESRPRAIISKTGEVTIPERDVEAA